MRFPCRAPTRALPLAGLLLLSSCEQGGTGPRLEAAWTGTDTGAIATTARVAWCPVAARLEVTAIRADQGFGLVIFPVGDSLSAGEFQSFDPGIDTAARPGVAAAARWFTDERMAAFQSDSGSLELARAGNGYDARFGFRLRGLDGQDTLVVTGRATGLMVDTPCPADSVPASEFAPPADSQAPADSTPRRRRE